MRAVSGLVLRALAAVAGCWGRSKDTGMGAEKEMAAREAELAQKLAAPASDSGDGSPLAVWVLPPELAEISGATLTSTGLLFAHSDEQGRVATIDPRKGSLVQRFSLGTGVRDDFEGITRVADTVFMATSKGLLYRFQPGGDGQEVRFETHDTGLAEACEFEGVAYDSAASSLVLVCKNVYGKEHEDQLLLYRVSLADLAAPPTPLAIPLASVVGTNDWKNLHPSDITVDPATGHYVIIASQERALIELTPSGEVVRSEPLHKRHRQPEAVAITADGLLVIGDEARKGEASITLYRWRPRAASE